uniref:G-protein coupled receptors family 1 profile domain-containing protein n=1 Tax=Panagrellus redivivus TaxID=6233 RepID=A0A7E4VUM5_PANRE
MGPILNVLFQPPALGAVFRGPIILFIYRNFGYKMCKVMTCFIFYALVAILCTQNYGVFFRFFAILPNKAYYEWFNSIPGFAYIYGSCITASGTVAVLVYLVLYDENEIPYAMLEYEDPNTTFADYKPGQDVLILCKRNTIIWYVIVGVASVGLLYIEANSYAMFFIAKRILKKYAASFTKQTYSLHRQFLYLLMVQITMPILLIVVPLVFLIWLRTLGADFAKLQIDCGTLSTASYSFVNVLLTIFCISPFRKFTKRITIDVVLKRLGVKVDVSHVVLPAPTSSLNFSSRT